MNTLTSLIKRYPQVTFWSLSYLTAFIAFFMNERDPSRPWIMLLYGTFLAGILVTAVVDGRKGLKTYFSRIVRWRTGIQWYAIALFLPLILRLAAFGLNLLSGATLETNIQWPAGSDLVVGFFWPSFLGIALAEEPAIRGFSLSRLLARHSALKAALILGVLHVVWHLPLFLLGSDSPVIILIIISGAILNTWLFNKTNGSVLIAMILHASVDILVGVFNPLFSGADAERQTIWLAVVFVAMAVFIPVLTGSELGRETGKTEGIDHNNQWIPVK